jgi:2-polyprenyl-6-methoxyphenol hydroxylase-like FAD-dependent oxidoreductase
VKKQKIVIIGGGVAGLASAIMLKDTDNWDISVYEGAPLYKPVGQGFILMPNGVEVLYNLGLKEYLYGSGNTISCYVNKNLEEKVMVESSINECMVVKRTTLIDMLYSNLGPYTVKFGYELKAFDFDDKTGQVILSFKNGVTENADIVIAADGSKSIFRQQLFPDIIPYPNGITEIVGITTIPQGILLDRSQLLKFQSEKEGLAMGIVICSDEELIWYVQYSNAIFTDTFNSQEEIREFVSSKTAGWPHPVKAIVDHTDFANVHVWVTNSMELLPAFHHKHIVLVGDSAHVFVPFTSQGTNTALVDAAVLCDLLVTEAGDVAREEIFNEDYRLRKNDVLKYIHFGKTLTQQFIDPVHHPPGEQIVPLAK